MWIILMFIPNNKDGTRSSFLRVSLADVDSCHDRSELGAHVGEVRRSASFATLGGYAGEVARSVLERVWYEICIMNLIAVFLLFLLGLFDFLSRMWECAVLAVHLRFFFLFIVFALHGMILLRY